MEAFSFQDHLLFLRASEVSVIGQRAILTLLSSSSHRHLQGSHGCIRRNKVRQLQPMRDAVHLGPRGHIPTHHVVGVLGQAVDLADVRGNLVDDTFGDCQRDPADGEAVRRVAGVRHADVDIPLPLGC